MKEFNYKTITGADVNLTIISLDNIVAKINKKDMEFTAECNNYFVYPPRKKSLISLTFKKEININNNFIKGIAITEEVKEYIIKLKNKKDFEKISEFDKAKFLFNNSYLPNIKKHATDMATGLIYCSFVKKVEYKDWKKVSHLFIFIDTEKDDTDFQDGAQYKGYVTTKEEEVCNILSPNWREIYNKNKKIFEMQIEIENKNKDDRKLHFNKNEKRKKLSPALIWSI